jgi:pyrimidine-nucleoside phosphorylase
MQSKIADNEKAARRMLLEVIDNKKALNKLKEMVVYQDGDGSYIDDISKFKKAKDVIEIKSNKAGYIKDIYADELGIVSMKLSGGRKKLEDSIDHSVGLVLNKKISDYVNIGDILLYVHTNNGLDEDIKNDILNAYNIVDDKVEKPVLIEEIL